MAPATAQGEQMEKVLFPVLNQAAVLLQIPAQAEVSVVLADDQYIQELNRQYRGQDCVTDVLSFALNEGDEPAVLNGPEQTLLGDIVISLPAAARQAEEYGHSVAREVAYLAVHGLLHLLGYDHQTAAAQAVMREREEEILRAAALARD